MLTRRQLLSISALATPLWPLAQASEEAFPTRPVKLVVAYPPGGTTDVLARVLATKLGERWKQPVIVENRAGAGGNIGTEGVARATPDGYTLLMGVAATHAINPAVFSSLPYDPVKDFTPISMMGVVPGVIAVRADSPMRSIADLVAQGRKGARLNYGTPSAGSMSHLTGELINQLTGIRMQHVAYKGSNPALTDLLAGHIEVLVDNLPPSMPHIQSGKLRALAVTSPARLPPLPEVPTMIEHGYRGFDLQGWFAVFGPAAMPPALVSRIHADVAAALAQPDLRKHLAGQGIDTQSSTPSELGARVRLDSERLRKVARDAGISLTR
jgi:tripartite-type tricarboxylate transporter receptor subunit TctC